MRSRTAAEPLSPTAPLRVRVIYLLFLEYHHARVLPLRDEQLLADQFDAAGTYRVGGDDPHRLAAVEVQPYLGAAPDRSSGEDDVRLMDWSVTARTDTPHVRDLVADPDDWRKIYVLDTTGHVWFADITGKDVTVAATGVNPVVWQELTGNLDFLPGGDTVTSIEMVRVAATDVLLVGGQGGLFRKVGTDAWTEYGVGLPILKAIGVTDQRLRAQADADAHLHAGEPTSARTRRCPGHTAPGTGHGG